MDFTSSHGQQLARHLGFQLASARLDQHLEKAIEELKPPPKEARAMRGLSRLTNLTNQIMTQIDQQAGQMADEIQKSHDEIQTCMDGFAQVNQQMKQVATEAKAALSQMTNGLPT